MQQFKDRNKGERCFVLGNGPSQNLCDLNRLAKERTFGCNMIFTNEKVRWRPSYYCVSDPAILSLFQNEINSYHGPTKFYPRTLMQWAVPNRHTYFFPVRSRHYPDRPLRGKSFSLDASYVVWTGASVVFVMLQLAVYMGFNPIYLIGMDCDNNGHCSKNYHLGRQKYLRRRGGNTQRIWKIVSAYLEEARRVTEEEGIHILNATIGGSLEVFPRVHYSGLF